MLKELTEKDWKSAAEVADMQLAHRRHGPHLRWKSAAEVADMQHAFEKQIKGLKFERTLNRAFRVFLGIVTSVLVYLLIQHW